MNWASSWDTVTMFCVGNKQFVQNKKCRGTKKCVVAVLQPRLSWDTLTLVEQILTSDQCSLWPACPSSADHNTLICVTVNIITQLINIQQQSHLNCFVNISSPRGAECDFVEKYFERKCISLLDHYLWGGFSQCFLFTLLHWKHLFGESGSHCLGSEARWLTQI